MQNRTALFFLAALLLFVAAALGGCTADDSTVSQDFAPDLSVNILVPYQTTTPTAAPEATAPFTISSSGDVKLLDSSWVESEFKAVAGNTSGQESYTQLRLGDTSEAVSRLQTRLKELSYYTGDVSGVFDDATEQAVRLFELTYGTMQTGIATEKLQTLLFASTAPAYGSEDYEQAKSAHYETLQLGDVGSGVLYLQYRLMELGYPITQATGQYNQETANAVALFYEAYGLDANEVAIIALQKELFSDNAKPYGNATVDTTQSDNTAVQNDDLTTLKEGNIGTLVTQLQTRLIELGYLTGSASGTYDAQTTEAVKAFQNAIGVEETGIATAQLQSQILFFDVPIASESPEPTDNSGYRLLQEGDSGDDVYTLQRRLVTLGYANGTPDGNFGPATATAVSLFQKGANLAETGVATIATQLALYAENAPQYVKTSETDLLYPSGIELVELTAGAQGEAVSYLQRRLAQLDYYKGDADAVYGESTQEAVKKLQAALCIADTGVASVSFQRYIYSNAAPKSGMFFFDKAQNFETLSPGDSGDQVTELQKQLWELGYLNTDDIKDSVGTYNDATTQSVSKAQSAMGYLEPDGIAGAEFQAFLFSKYNTYIKKES